MAATTPTKTWRERVDRWISAARESRDVSTLRGQADWFDRVQPRLTAVSDADRADMAAALRTTLAELGA